MAPPGACGLHRPERDPRGSGQHCFKKHAGSTAWKHAGRFVKSECGWHRQTALSERVRVAPPGAPGTSADSPIEAGPSYRSCAARPQRRRGVTVSSLIETICEL